ARASQSDERFNRRLRVSISIAIVDVRTTKEILVLPCCRRSELRTPAPIWINIARGWGRIA
ncbi:hypothetical protein M3P21_01860, partial [Ruegeria sp. 2012CJ41-6]